MKFLPVGIKKELIKDFESLLPGDPEIPSGQKTGDCMTSKVVDPTLGGNVLVRLFSVV